MNQCIALLGFLFVCQLSEAKLTLDGHYQGKNLYVQNPMNDDLEFCVDSIYINGWKANTNHNSSAFEIDLRGMHFSMGAPLHIEIFHKDGCAPKILGANNSSPRQISPIKNLRIDGDTLKFETKNGNDTPYFLEVYRWNKWVLLQVIDDIDSAEFKLNLTDIAHSGENEIRIRYTKSDGVTSPTKELNYTSSKEEVKMTVDRHEGVITFSEPTSYEVFTVQGNRLTKGHGTRLDLSIYSENECDGNNQLFYLNLDNRNEKLKLHHH